MKRILLFFLIVGIGLLAAQCSTMPKTTVSGLGNEGKVVILCEPSNAWVYVDGNKVGKASKFDSESNPLTLSNGSHVIELRKKGYQSYRKEVYVGNRVLQRVEATLTKE
ncbi:MAG: PEGA domain-containing protein [Deltaproteobacteria bacterium]|nr:PEGA domain-containing protein [Deltaproteobacteria bacterium]